MEEKTLPSRKKTLFQLSYLALFFADIWFFTCFVIASINSDTLTANIYLAISIVLGILAYLVDVKIIRKLT